MSVVVSSIRLVVSSFLVCADLLFAMPFLFAALIVDLNVLVIM